MLKISEIVLVSGFVLHCFDTAMKWQQPIGVLCIFGSQCIIDRSFCLCVRLIPKNLRLLFIMYLIMHVSLDISNFA